MKEVVSYNTQGVEIRLSLEENKMDYRKIYFQIVEAALTRDPPTCYTEKHHIVPKCIGGCDHKDNLVTLTAREHFLAHWLLTKMYPEEDKLIYAWAMMCVSTSLQDRYTSHSFRYAREARADRMRGMTWNHTLEAKQKISKAAKTRIGPLNSRYGATLTDEHKAILLDTKFVGLWQVEDRLYRFATHAAKAEGIPRTTLQRKCKKGEGIFNFIPREEATDDQIQRAQ